MHMKSAMKSVRLRLFWANCRSDRQLEPELARSPPMGGCSLVNALVVEGSSFDDRDPLSPASRALRRPDARGRRCEVAKPDR
jgi:hypothetical protein